MATETLKRKPGRPKGLPKTGGRKKGVCNKVTREVRDWARSILEDPQVQAKTLEMAREGKLPPGLYSELLHYAYGKPKEHVELPDADGAPLKFTLRLDMGGE